MRFGICGGSSRAATHTKKKRVQTWSETGHTQMFPCFCKSLDVITVWVKNEGEIVHFQALIVRHSALDNVDGSKGPPRLSVSFSLRAVAAAGYYLHTGRCSSDSDSGGTSTVWDGSIDENKRETTVKAPAVVLMRRSRSIFLEIFSNFGR